MIAAIAQLCALAALATSAAAEDCSCPCSGAARPTVLDVTSCGMCTADICLRSAGCAVSEAICGTAEPLGALGNSTAMDDDTDDDTPAADDDSNAPGSVIPISFLPYKGRYKVTRQQTSPIAVTTVSDLCIKFSPLPAWSYTITTTVASQSISVKQDSAVIEAMYSGGSRSGFTDLAYIVAKVSGTDQTGTRYSNKYTCVTVGRTTSTSTRETAFQTSNIYDSKATATSNCVPTSSLSPTGEYVLPRTKADCSGASNAAVAAASGFIALAAAVVGLSSRREE